MDVHVEIAREASQELVDAFGRLLPQLSSTADPLGYEAIDRMVTCDANTVLVARTSDEIVGTLTLVLLPLPSGLRARVEDVVVDSVARGRESPASSPRRPCGLPRRQVPGRSISPPGRIVRQRTGFMNVWASRPGSQRSTASRSTGRTSTNADTQAVS